MTTLVALRNACRLIPAPLQAAIASSPSSLFGFPSRQFDLNNRPSEAHDHRHTAEAVQNYLYTIRTAEC